MRVNAAAGTVTKTITRTFNVSLFPTSSTVSVGTGSISIPNNSYTISITEPQHTESGSGRYTESQTGYISTYSTTIPATVYSGSVSSSSSSGDSISVRLDEAEGAIYYSCPLSWDIDYFDFPLSSFDSSYKYVSFVTWGYSASSSLGSFNNSQLTYLGDPATNFHFSSKKSIRLYDNGQYYLVPSLHSSGVFNYALMSNNARDDLARPINFTITVSFRLQISDLSDSEVAERSNLVNDITGNDLQTQGNTLQQQNNTITQDTNTVTHDTNNKVTSFFGAFWDNLLHIFVPESGFFQQWFSDLNTFMSQKLGFLWSPFDFVISFLNGIYSSSGGASPGIVFPGLTWIDGTVIIPQQTFSFDNIGGESFSDLRDMIYFATDIILLGAVVHQFYQKIKIVFEGGSD